MEAQLPLRLQEVLEVRSQRQLHPRGRKPPCPALAVPERQGEAHSEPLEPLSAEPKQFDEDPPEPEWLAERLVAVD